MPKVVLTRKLRRFLPLTASQIKPSLEINLGSYVDIPSGFYGTNPSLIAVGNGYLVCIRCVNYVFGPRGMTQPIFTTGDRYRTLNRFLLLSHDLRFVRSLPALDEVFTDIEDIKLFTFGDHVMGLGSYLKSSKPSFSVIALIKIANDFRGGDIELIPSPLGHRQEKNWAPFVAGQHLCFIYSFDPLIILSYDPDKKSTTFEHPSSQQHISSELPFLTGGSSAGLPVSAGHIFATHRRKVSIPQIRRCYVSRLVYLNLKRTKLAGGPYFTLSDKPVQFVNGLERHEGGFLIAYGLMDNQAYLCKVSRNDISSSTWPYL